MSTFLLREWGRFQCILGYAKGKCESFKLRVLLQLKTSGKHIIPCMSFREMIIQPLLLAGPHRKGSIFIQVHIKFKMKVCAARRLKLFDGMLGTFFFVSVLFQVKN